MSESPAQRTRDVPGDLATALLAERTVSGLLDKVLDVAVATIRDVSAASISIGGARSQYQTVSASHHVARSLDQVQYSTDGPCVEAIRTAREVVIELPVERWGEFSAAACAQGFTSVWSLPLVEEEGPATGSLNLYSAVGPTWQAETARAARLVADQSAVVLASARELARCEHANATLRQALDTRTVIGQAQGVLMARQSISADEAFDILRRASQRTNRKLRDIAAEIVASLGIDPEPD